MRNHNNSDRNVYYSSPFTRNVIVIEDLESIIKKGNNHGVCGSRNLGNTCYMNSSIACLSNCLELTTFFLTKEYKKHINKNNKDGVGGKLAEEWYNLLKEYWTSNREEGSPKRIKEIVGSKNRKFLGYGQQDSNEFMTVFLELLGEDLNATTVKKYQELKEQQENEKDIECAQRFWNLHVERNNNIITDLFHGLFKSTIVCPRCNWRNITYDPFNTLALTIPSLSRLKNLIRRQKQKEIKKKKKLNNKKNHKKNEQVQIGLYYVPPLSLIQTKKFDIKINPNISLNDIIKEIQKRQNNVRVTNNLYYAVVSDKEYQCTLDPSKPKTNDPFIFAYERESKDKFNYSVPIYLSSNEKKSAYPRIVFFPRKTIYNDFKKKIYILIRKYLKHPLIGRNDPNEDFESQIELKKYIDGTSNRLYKILELIGKEYDAIQFEQNKYENFMNDFPYEINIKKRFESNNYHTISKGGFDEWELLSRNFNIEGPDSYADSLFNQLINKNCFLEIKVNNNSQYAVEKILFDNCTIEKCSDEPENNDEMEIENETSNTNSNANENNCESDSGSDDNENSESEQNQKMNIDMNCITLEHCIQYFTDEESLEEGNEWHCSNCKRKVMASKKIEIFYLPRIMCICLTRFSKRGKMFSYTKNDEHVFFPIENLDMGKYVCGPDKKYSKYDLFAVSEHYGGMGGGHYTAICKNYDGYWYKYDDSKCYRVKPDNICSNAAYVLFYRRKNW